MDIKGKLLEALLSGDVESVPGGVAVKMNSAKMDDDIKKTLQPVELQEELLKDFVNATMPKSKKIKVGTFVSRNNVGRAVYRFPLDGQLAICVAVYGESRQSNDKDDSHDIVSGEIAYMGGDKNLHMVAVDLRFYEPDKLFHPE